MGTSGGFVSGLGMKWSCEGHTRVTRTAACAREGGWDATVLSFVRGGVLGDRAVVVIRKWWEGWGGAWRDGDTGIERGCVCHVDIWII